MPEEKTARYPAPGPRMKKLSRIAVSASLTVRSILLSIVSLGPCGPAIAQSLSPPVFQVLRDARDYLDAHMYSDAVTKLEAADHTLAKTPYDQHMINGFLAKAYAETRNYPELVRVLEAEVDDGFSTQTERGKQLRSLSQLHYEMKNYGKAIEVGNRAINAGDTEDQMFVLVAQAYYLLGQFAQLIQFLDPYVDRQLSQRQLVDEKHWKILIASCAKLNDNACVQREQARWNNQAAVVASSSTRPAAPTASGNAEPAQTAFGSRAPQATRTGDAHECVSVDPLYEGGPSPYMLRFHNVCGQDIKVSACARKDSGWLCKGGGLTPNDYYALDELGVFCVTASCSEWTVEWNAIYSSPATPFPPSPHRTEAGRGH
jgi:tetratricopeptide (TPR) repeat protein